MGEDDGGEEFQVQDPGKGSGSRGKFLVHEQEE